MRISNEINKYMENRRKIANKEKINTKLNKYIKKYREHLKKYNEDKYRRRNRKETAD